MKVTHTRITSSFSFAEEGKVIQMSDTALVASYNPLKPVFPQSGETLVALGSSVQVDG
jgi:hypothetical protein